MKHTKQEQADTDKKTMTPTMITVSDLMGMWNESEVEGTVGAGAVRTGGSEFDAGGGGGCCGSLFG